MTDFFVNLIASGENMRFVYGMFAVWMLAGAILVGALNKPQWFSSWLISSIVLMFGVLNVDAELHRSLYERRTTHLMMFQEDGRTIGLLNHSKRSRVSINDEFGEWEIFDITISEQYKTYLILLQEAI